MVSVFYNNKKVWDVAGYQGAAYDQGGYYLRGFQDADWPQPPKDASPKGLVGIIIEENKISWQKNLI